MAFQKEEDCFTISTTIYLVEVFFLFFLRCWNSLPPPHFVRHSMIARWILRWFDHNFLQLPTAAPVVRLSCLLLSIPKIPIVFLPSNSMAIWREKNPSEADSLNAHLLMSSYCHLRIMNLGRSHPEQIDSHRTDKILLSKLILFPSCVRASF